MMFVVNYYTVTILLATIITLLTKFVSHKVKKRKVTGIPSAVVNGESPYDERTHADVIIVGAGVACASLAYSLAKDGCRVRVVERDLSEPNRISGELLHPGGYLKLTELGLEDCVENIDAQRVVGYVMYKDGKKITSAYPLENFSSGVAGRSFYNGRFVQKLREKAASLPKAYAPLTIVCDGCTSNLRRSLCSPMVDIVSHFVGFELKNCHLSSPNHGHIVLADPSLLLFYPITHEIVRCLVDVPTGAGQKLPSLSNDDMAKYLKTVVAPQVPSEQYEPFLAAVDEGNIRTLPVREMPANPKPSYGALVIGDALNMRHAYTGAGMTVALSDVVLLRDLLRHVQDLNDSAALYRCSQSFYSLRKPRASIINIMAGIFYKFLLASLDKGQMEMRDALFDYLSRGGEYLTLPTALLSGLNPQPVSLVAHLLAVGLYAFGRLLLPFPSPKHLWLGMRLLKGAAGIIVPQFQAEGLGQMFFPAKFQQCNK